MNAIQQALHDQRCKLNCRTSLRLVESSLITINSTVDPEIITHLERIGKIIEGMSLHSAWSDEERENSFDSLSRFDQEYWAFTKHLSLLLYEETAQLLMQPQSSITEQAEIAVVIPVFRPDPFLLPLSLQSALSQVGVRVHLYISLDGPEADRPLVERVLEQVDCHGQRVTLLPNAENRGVALCRNAALKAIDEEWFTFLDCDDLFHPLRLLHAWLVMASTDVIWLNTGCSRVSLKLRKIMLTNHVLSANGFNSIFAQRRVLQAYGYLAPLRFWEDTEYQNRLVFFGAPVLNCTAVGHYANGRMNASGSSLGSRWRREFHPIEGHPWLCATIEGDLDPTTIKIRDYFEGLYPSLNPEQLGKQFPPDGSPGGLPAWN